MKPLKIDTEARTESIEGVRHIETQRAGYGKLLKKQFDQALRRISSNPKSHSPVGNGVRKVVIRKYRYNIYFIEESSTIRIISFFHTSRDPAEWQRRV